jgi:hypothetical protein
MNTAALSLLRQPMQGDGVLRVPLSRAADPSLMFLIQRGLIKPLPFADAAGLEIWYEVGASAFLETRNAWAAIHSAHR